MFDMMRFKKAATYCNLTGNFYWNKGQSKAGLNCSRVNNSACNVNSRFKELIFEQEYLFTHRAVWMYHHGPIDRHTIILFKNGNTLDTRIENLYAKVLEKHDTVNGITHSFYKDGSDRFYVNRKGLSHKTFNNLPEAIKYRDSLCTR
jgi:hypothetical protein